MDSPITDAGAQRRHPRTRTRLLVASISLAALLGAAPSALADTTVSIEFGQFGSGLSGRHVFIRDTASFPFDQKMDVVATRSGGDVVVTDAVGQVHAKGICQEVGSTVRCPDTNVVGLRFEGGNKNDALTNSTDLPGVMLGNFGADVLQGGPSNDQLNGQDDDDKAFGGPGDDRFFAEPGADKLDGEDGSRDLIDYLAAPAPVDIQLDDVTANDGVAGEGDLLRNMENGRGSAFDDDIDGSDAANLLLGSDGDDTIRGRAGNDRMIGGRGGDSLDGDGDTDSAEYTDHTARVVVDIDGSATPADDGNADDGPVNDRDNVLSDTENIVGGPGGDTLIGHQAVPVANTLDGREGNDTLEGREGDDRLLGGLGGDQLFGSGGLDELRGAENDDQLDGGADPDVLDGGLDRDLASYASRTEDITVTLDDATTSDDGGASDGAPGRRDSAVGIERVTTGDGNDVVEGDGSDEQVSTGDGDDILTGNDGDDSLDAGDAGDGLTGKARDELTGNGGADTLKSGNGDDILTGNDGDDSLDGGAGTDAYSGGSGKDTLNTDDDEVDKPISCGEDPGETPAQNLSIDVIDADLVDRDANPGITIPGDPAECESGTFSTP